MLSKVLKVLLVVAIVMLCYYVVIWVLGLLGVNVPHQILVCGLVIIGLIGVIGALSGKFDDINWWK